MMRDASGRENLALLGGSMVASTLPGDAPSTRSCLVSSKKRWMFGGVVTGVCATVALVVSLGAGAGTTVVTAAPNNTSPPTITGKAVEGERLMGKRGSWSGTVADYNDQWMRCDKDGGSCANISDATDRNGYVLKNVDVGNTIRFKVEAKNADGSTFASSVPTSVVTAATTPPPPVTNGCTKTGGTVPVAGITSPAHLLIDQTQVSPSTITFGTRSLTARFHITACKGDVQGALVFVTAVPYGMFAAANEQATGADGWATLQFTALAGFPVQGRRRKGSGAPEPSLHEEWSPRDPQSKGTTWVQQ